MPTASRLLDLVPPRPEPDATGVSIVEALGWTAVSHACPAESPAWGPADSEAVVARLPVAGSAWGQRLLAEIDAHVAGLTPRVEVVYMTQDGRWQHLSAAAGRDASGAVREVRGVVRDVDAGERDRRELGRAHSWLRELVDQLPEAVVVWRDGEELLRNRRAERLLGDQRDLGGLLAGFSPAARIEVVAHLTAAARGERPGVVSAKTDLVGRGTWLELSSSALETRDGPAVLSVVRDVTERRCLEQESAAQARMATVGTLAAGVAHEINNPLCFMQLNLEMLREDLPEALARLARLGDPGEVEAARAELMARLEDVLTGAGRVREVVADLKVFSHASSQDAERIDAGDAVRLALSLGRHQLKHRAEVELCLTEPLPVVAHLGRLSQVFLNLMVNAAQAMEEGGAGRIRVSGERRAGRVLLRVEDDGPGVPPDARQRIFDPFYTSKDVGEGTGLGLSISQKIAESVGGRLSLTDSELGGAGFCVDLPEAEAGQRPTLEPSERADDVATAPPRHRLLVVDDEALLLSALERRLIREFDVDTAPDGRAALAALESGATPDALLLDVMMPVVDGPAVYAWIQRNRPELQDRVVFMTGGAVTASARDFLARVPNLTLSKPLDIGALVSQMRVLLAAPPDAPAAEGGASSADIDADLLERRRAPRVPAPRLAGCLAVGRDAHRVDVVDLSAVGLRVRGSIQADASLMLEPLALELVHRDTRAKATVEVRCVRSRGVDGGGELGLELTAAAREALPPVFQQWAAA